AARGIRHGLPLGAERRIGGQCEEKEECGDAQEESDEFVQTAVPGWRKNVGKKWGSDSVAGAKFTHSTVTWPELNNYDKKQGFGQCGKRGGVPSWVRAEHLHGLLV